jgi:hypothetical protein
MQTGVRIVAMIAVLVLTAGCGSGANRGVETVLSGAADSTTGAGTARIAFTEHEFETADPSMDRSTTSGEGVYDMVARKGRFNYSTTVDGEEIGHTDFLLFGDTAYFKSKFVAPFVIEDEDPTRPWEEVTADPTEASTEAELLLDSPDSVLKRLRDLAGPVRRLGTETVRGTHTTHYTATSDHPNRRNGATARTDVVRPPAAVDVWVDDHDRIRRLAINRVFPEGREGDGVATTDVFSYDLFDFGVDVRVEPPPADQIHPHHGD